MAISLGGRRLSGRDGTASFLRRFPTPLPEQTLLVVFSPLLGEGMTELLGDLPSTTALLLVDFEEDLFHLGSHPLSKFPPLPCHRCLRASSRDEAIRGARRLVEERGLRRVTAVHATGGARLHASAYARLEENLREIVQRFWSNRGTQIRLGRRWVSNLLANACLEQTPLQKVAQSCSFSRAVLLGAGCDLDNHLETARSLQGRGVPLIALDTALPALAEAGLEPEVIVAMDSQLANAKDLLPWRWDRTTLIADLTVHPTIPRRFLPEQRSFFVSRFGKVSFFSPDPASQVLAGIPVVSPRGSVAPAALDILVRLLGVRTVLTIGIDFHYRLPRTHAHLTAGDRRMRSEMTRLLRRDGNHEYLLRPRRDVLLRTGQPARGDAILADQALQMHHTTTELQRFLPDLRVFCLNGEGLETGATLIPTGDLLSRFQESPPAPAMEQAGSETGGPSGQALRREALESLLARLRLQEEHPGFIDSGLDFVLLDLPQWPLLTTRTEWALLQRERILRSTRDYRRRLERILSAFS
ncbi:Protein of unknown function DUF115 [Alkalispirochaeta americana]|uniref:6-hydroxymethylpterin diphosphokinase MptE-like domain-containing protein n=1 Tax=Alkalispirochaeta americana TaxID=159291 RepID=A0A1N6UHY7_9SPIO|nr:Protein of unknown function DUF115 [Alkalispirochaeta americana]